jgi:hypothetical protein
MFLRSPLKIQWKILRIPPLATVNAHRVSIDQIVYITVPIVDLFLPKNHLNVASHPLLSPQSEPVQEISS